VRDQGPDFSLCDDRVSITCGVSSVGGAGSYAAAKGVCNQYTQKARFLILWVLPAV
jgi:hypothetical protein